jgi:hypothetical protein
MAAPCGDASKVEKFEFALELSHEEGCTAADGNPPQGPNSVFVRNQLGRGDDADAAPEYCRCVAMLRAEADLAT